MKEQEERKILEYLKAVFIVKELGKIKIDYFPYPVTKTPHLLLSKRKKDCVIFINNGDIVIRYSNLRQWLKRESFPLSDPNCFNKVIARISTWRQNAN